ncbi:MAG: hypothetical protein A3H69_03485 [Candidatus Sungbacteria bacterium RIFCSPLOWO2_02_FULL_47_9]|uniref:UDP-N-acetylglucosamine--N-acetylmuramyl-(pentapeptide) pyrophosphoryl-undecaprenol N-acetylglucosamine transferase n=1 Tax=Candidatus Sungbacteria bacterium RIFCSPHIGHO2_01_FULL_47_32 TaxID=1802264 RepID=A0A1G2K2H6_9BACT|nr:MAG: hypothetical protein UX72_C0017G0021 [Parcubacteria group bacterium GW2011_GWA2_47_10]OGZ93624.1 MAG: hypothetical protein A2633_04695 [Candidatus Sungbacteria bacterium RIFCSPHIGHO2_01_FULL_47_32]OHA05465.1 MAG: hypothetical protein A3A28_03155 [Candidatus Sungbacteria bacterium RIFCSPLOWO2_01_FULL_47_32]OHA11585.1 MAG: hypothetical protein A3H69_03485 [Candidatus Sungbacteria bacterium RIFCSPLOWO2_02_FULL_47_9]
MRVLFTGGGTGGHMFPLIAVARELKRVAEEERILDVQFFYMGPLTVGDEDLKKEDILYYPILAGKMRRYFSIMNFIDIFKTGIGIIQSAWHLFILVPDIIFSKGGYGSFPVLLIARIYRIPVVIHESDSVPGRVNTWAGKFARRIAIAFQSAAKYFPADRTALLGNPVRTRILGGRADASKEALSILSGDPVIFVTGGSQGAEKINQTITGILPDLLKKYEVIHQVGKANLEAVKFETTTLLEHSEKLKYHLFGFLDETKLREAYAASDLVIARGGASAIFEVAALAKPSIIIPLKNSAQDHQRENAYEYGRAGACVVIEEANLSPHLLYSEVERIFGDAELRKKMNEAARNFARMDASELIAREILKLGLH